MQKQANAQPLAHDYAPSNHPAFWQQSESNFAEEQRIRKQDAKIIQLGVLALAMFWDLVCLWAWFGGSL